MQNWHPSASRAQDFSAKYKGSTIVPNVVVIHSTEGTGWPGYNGGGSAPHLTIMPDFTKKKLVIRQHFPFNKSSRALVNAAGGVETNTLNAIQLELVGTCDPYTHSVWTKKGIRHIYMPDLPSWYKEELAKLFLWMHRNMPKIPLKDAALRGWKAYPDSYGVRNKNRLTFSEWNNAYGFVGHQHVPENSHGDPGAMPMPEIIKRALELEKPNTPAPTPAPKPPKEDIVLEEFGIITFINTQGNGNAKAQASFKKRMPSFCKVPIDRNAALIGFCEVRPGEQEDALTDYMTKKGWVRRGHFKDAKLMLFARKDIRPVGSIYRTTFKKQNAGQKEGVLARTFVNSKTGSKGTFGLVHLDYRDGFDHGRVEQAKEGFKEIERIAKIDKADFCVLFGDMNSHSWVTTRAAKPAGYRDAYVDVDKGSIDRIDYFYLDENCEASSVSQIEADTDHKVQNMRLKVRVRK